METNSHKRSRAFIITFIAVIILLIVGYFLLFKDGGVFSTKGTSSEQKSFFPLLGSSKKKAEKVESPTAPDGTPIGTETSIDGAVPLFNPVPGPNGKEPRVTLSATPKILDAKGGNVKLTWKGENVSSCIPSWTGKRIAQTSGTSNELTVKKTRLFSIACTNGITTTGATVQVSVVGSSTLGIALFANPDVLDSAGKVKLSWTSNNSVKTCTPSWTNRKNDSEGDATVTVNESKTFSINCTDGTTFEIAEVDVIVTEFYSNIRECNDGLDNDGDKTTDMADSSCHTDFDATNEATYNPRISPESRSPVSQADDHCKALDENPLKFTDAEKRELDKLLRQFYRVAPKLKTQDDVLAEYSAREGYIDLYKEARDLTQQCFNQRYPVENNANRVAVGATPNYTGPQETKTNPYYQPAGVVSSPTYITEAYQDTKFKNWENKVIALHMATLAELDAKIQSAKAAKNKAREILFTQLQKYEQNQLNNFIDLARRRNEFIQIQTILQIW